MEDAGHLNSEFGHLNSEFGLCMPQYDNDFLCAPSKRLISVLLWLDKDCTFSIFLQNVWT